MDAVVLLRPNHGGSSSLRRVSSLALVREVMEECALPAIERAGAVRAITQVISNARGFDLSLGDLAGAVAYVDRVFDDII